MRRFVVVACTAFCCFCASALVDAQRSTAVAKLGFLSPIERPTPEEAFWAELRRLGYVEGKSIDVFYRAAGGNFERLPALASELVGLKVDVIVAYVTEASLAAMKATPSIPIVMIAVSDPVGSGLVASLARPGGNVTGTSGLSAGVAGKQLELLREFRPGVRRVAVLWNPGNRVFQQQSATQARKAASGLGMELQFFDARKPDELEGVFSRIGGERHELLLVLADPLFTAHVKRIADLTVRHRLIAVSGARAYADAGFIAAYGPDFADAYRRAATYVHRILHGARPSDLPVEQSTKFELVINTKTARMLGMTIPPSMMARADQLIE